MTDKMADNNADNFHDMDKLSDDTAMEGNMPNQKERFVVKKWVAHGHWSWDVAVDNCAICRNHIMDICIECQAAANGNKEDCNVAWGQCNHAFHYHCIARWLKTRNVCPLDNQEWSYQKYGR